MARRRPWDAVVVGGGVVGCAVLRELTVRLGWLTLTLTITITITMTLTPGALYVRSEVVVDPWLLLLPLLPLPLLLLGAPRLARECLGSGLAVQNGAERRSPRRRGRRPGPTPWP